ncbi:MAG: hypothetical protein LBP69_02215 [Treponema sp.]|jgi:hypothetical protein|nr:hypothetical protein [Treponema sp.]
MAFLRSKRRRTAQRRTFFPFTALLLLPVFSFAQESPQNRLESQRRAITEEADSELVRMNVNDSEVSLIARGFWKGTLSVNWGISRSPLGVSPDSEDSPLLFTQEVDLTLSLWIRERWFLEVSFLDDYNLNTYRAGYQGFPGETVQYVGVGNTGLDFPVFPYLDLGGDSPSSFGVYGRFGSGDLSFHSLVRYDAAAREERIFVGDRERSFSNLSPDKPLRGVSFVLPDENISAVPVVYIEDKNGGLTDTGGRKWRLAVPSEYAVSGINGVVELAREPAGMVAVSYPGVSSAGTPGLGNYFDAPGTSYLGDVRAFFAGTNLSQYPQPGGAAAPGTVIINGASALVIYEPGTFSPFERQSRYRSPSATSEDAALIRTSSGERIPGFEALPADSLVLSLELPLYSQSGDDSQRGVFELVSAAGQNDRRTPESMWPLAEDYPAIYLPGKQSFTDDISIRFTNYGPAGAYVIGTDVVAGSVQVYRGGILDSQVSYDSGSGTVQLSSPVGFNEVIRITYLKRSEERRLGSLAAGVGLVYKPEEKPFSWEAALGLRWNVGQETYTEEGAVSPGTVGFGGRAAWDYDRLKASVSLGLGFEHPDTTGLYRIAGMEGNSEVVMGLSTSAAFISQAPSVTQELPFSLNLSLSKRADLVYRNYRNADIFGVSKLMPIDWNAPVVSDKQGPYPAMDADMEIFTAEFDLDASSLNGKDWTGFEVPLGEDGKLLEQAKAVVVPLRYYNFSHSNITVVVQFGVLSDPDLGTMENTNLIVEKRFFPTIPASPLPSGWANNENVTIILDDAKRQKLQNATHMRIVIINNDTASSLQGRLLAARPYSMGASWRAVTLSSAPPEITGAADPAVSLAEMRDPGLNNGTINRLHPSGVNHVLKVDWDSSIASAGADGRVSEIPLSQYKVLSFFLKTPEARPVTDPPSSTPFSSFRFIIGRGPSSFGNDNEIALEAAIPAAAFGAPGQWVKVELNYREKKVLIDGNSVPGADLRYRQGVFRRSGTDLYTSGSAYIAAFVESSAPLAAGTFSIDEICLEEPAPSYRLNTGTTLEWIHPEPIISINDTPVLSDFSVNTALETGATGDPFTPESETFTGMQSRSSAEITVLDTAVTGNLSFTVSNEVSYWSAGHGLSRSFGPVSIDERFNTAPYNKNFDHKLSVGLDSLLHAQLSSDIDYEIGKLKRFWDFSTGIDAVENGHPGFSVGADLGYTEKTDRPELWLENYGEAWTRSFPEMLIDSGSVSNGTIRNRDLHGRAAINVARTPLGANLSFDMTSSVSVPLRTTQSSSRGALEFPFVAGRLRGAFRSERTFSRLENGYGEDLGKDIEKYGGSLSASSPLWFTIPVYSIFDPGLEDSLDKTLDNYSSPGETENTRWSELFSVNLFFPERYDPLSLIIPVSFSSRIDRTLDQRLSTRLDVLTFSPALSFSGINLFGAMGTTPVFHFYRNDEFRHSVSGVFSFPKSEQPVWRLQAEQNLAFFGAKGAELDIHNTFTTGSTGWIESIAVLWTVPAEKTLLSLIYDKTMGRLGGADNFPAVKALAASDYERLRRESLELVIDRSGEYGDYSVILGHESLVRILGRLTLSAFSKLNVKLNEYSDTLSFMLNFGTSLSITF